MKTGLIVNPIAGMGGKVGLKGTDETLQDALAKGAKPIAPRRAIEFLQKLIQSELVTQIEVTTCPGSMGEREARKAGLPVKVLPVKIEKETTAEDTKRAVKLLISMDVDLIVFVGGDGTAKDIFDAMQGLKPTPVIGIPSGVKMYSGVFAVSPQDAVEVILALLQGKAKIEELEIIDSDERSIRNDAFNVRLHGYLKGPFLPAYVQGSKQLSQETEDEEDNQKATAKFILEEINSDCTLILGPGTTVGWVAELLGVKKTILGVDIYKNGKVLLDVDEETILKEVDDWKRTWIILSPIGHQGILLGRGNQQISAKIVKHAGKEHIVIAATKGKLRSLERNVLRVDTGDAYVDKMMKGYARVVTDYREWRLMEIM